MIDEDRLAKALYYVTSRPKDPLRANIALLNYYDFLKRKPKVKMNEFLTLLELLNRIKPTEEVLDYWLREFDRNLDIEDVH